MITRYASMCGPRALLRNHGITTTMIIVAIVIVIITILITIIIRFIIIYNHYDGNYY